MKKEKLIKPKIEKKEPIYIDKLELGEAEAYVGNLSESDKYQLLVRHLNILETTLNNCLLIQSHICVALMELCKKNGIDIDKELNK